MSGEQVRDWLVTYRGRARGPVTVLAVIADVPTDVDDAAIGDALEVWDRWPAWQARVRPGGSIDVRKRTRRDELPPVWTSLTWEQLRPKSRRVSVDLPGELHAAATRTARLAGCSLAELVRDTLLGACMTDGVDIAVPPVAFVDEPLPGLGGEQ